MSRTLSVFLAGLAALALLAGTSLIQANNQQATQKEKTEPDVIYVPTPQQAVDEMLKMAKAGSRQMV